MKKLQKLVLHKTTPLTAPQMKHITGGYDGGNDGYDHPWPVMCKMHFGYDVVESGYCTMDDPIACEMNLRGMYTELWAPHGGFECVCWKVY